MTTVAIDIQPQFRFTCMAANATHFYCARKIWLMNLTARQRWQIKGF